MQKDDILNEGRKTLRMEGEELIRHSNLIGEEFLAAVNLILECRGKLIITGVGKSGHIGAKIAATLASTGTPSFFVHPTEALHGDLGMFGADECVLAISYSGESEELVRILPHIKGFGCKIIGMAKDKNTSLGRLSDVFLSLDILGEACPLGAAPTVSTTLTLGLGDALGVALMRCRGFDKSDFAKFHPGGSLGKRLFLKVKNIMKDENLPIVSDDVSLKVAIDTMTHGKLGTVLLTDKDGKLSAILSDGDLRRALMDDKFDINDKAIKFGTKEPKVLRDKEMLAVDALGLLQKYKIQLLAIIDEQKRPIGVLHIHDLTALGL